MTTHDCIEQVKRCRSIIDLADLLNKIDAAGDCDARLMADYSGTYGGTEIDAPGVYSWDRWGVLVYDDRDGFIVVPRAEVLS